MEGGVEVAHPFDDFAARVHFIQHGRCLGGQTVKILIQFRLTDGQQANISTTTTTTATTTININQLALHFSFDFERFFKDFEGF